MNKVLRISLISVTAILLVSVISYFSLSHYIKHGITQNIQSLTENQPIFSAKRLSYDIRTTTYLSPVIENISFQHPSFRAPFRVGKVKINKSDEFNIDIEVIDIIIPVPDGVYNKIKDNSDIDIRQEKFNLHLKQKCQIKTCTQSILLISPNLLNSEIEVIFTNPKLIKKQYRELISSGTSIVELLNEIPVLTKYFSLSNKTPAKVGKFHEFTSSKPAIQLLNIIDAMFISGSTEVKLKVIGNSKSVKVISERTGAPFGHRLELYLNIGLSSAESGISIDIKQGDVVSAFQSSFSSNPIIDALNILRAINNLNDLAASVNIFTEFSLDLNVRDDNLTKTSVNSIYKITKYLNSEISKYKNKDNIAAINLYIEENINLFKLQELSLHVNVNPVGFNLLITSISPIANMNYSIGVVLDDVDLFLQSFLSQDYVSLYKSIRVERMAIKITNNYFLDLAKNLISVVTGMEDDKVIIEVESIISRLVLRGLERADKSNIKKESIFKLVDVKNTEEFTNKLNKSILNFKTIEFIIENLDKELPLSEFITHPNKILDKISIKIECLEHTCT